MSGGILEQLRGKLMCDQETAQYEIEVKCNEIKKIKNVTKKNKALSKIGLNRLQSLVILAMTQNQKLELS